MSHILFNIHFAIPLLIVSDSRCSTTLWAVFSFYEALHLKYWRVGISDFMDTSSIIHKSFILKLKALSLNVFYKSFMGIEGHLWTIHKVTRRSILYEVFGPLNLDFDFFIQKNCTFECFESVMGKSASMNFFFFCGHWCRSPRWLKSPSRLLNIWSWKYLRVYQMSSPLIFIYILFLVWCDNSLTKTGDQ